MCTQTCGRAVDDVVTNAMFSGMQEAPVQTIGSFIISVEKCTPPACDQPLQIVGRTGRMPRGGVAASPTIAAPLRNEGVARGGGWKGTPLA